MTYYIPHITWGSIIPYKQVTRVLIDCLTGIVGGIFGCNPCDLQRFSGLQKTLRKSRIGKYTGPLAAHDSLPPIGRLRKKMCFLNRSQSADLIQMLHLQIGRRFFPTSCRVTQIPPPQKNTDQSLMRVHLFSLYLEKRLLKCCLEMLVWLGFFGPPRKKRTQTLQLSPALI